MTKLGYVVAVVVGLGLFIAAVYYTLLWYDWKLLAIILAFWWVADINNNIKKHNAK